MAPRIVSYLIINIIMTKHKHEKCQKLCYLGYFVDQPIMHNNIPITDGNMCQMSAKINNQSKLSDRSFIKVQSVKRNFTLPTPHPPPHSTSSM